MSRISYIDGIFLWCHRNKIFFPFYCLLWPSHLWNAFYIFTQSISRSRLSHMFSLLSLILLPLYFIFIFCLVLFRPTHLSLNVRQRKKTINRHTVLISNKKMRHIWKLSSSHIFFFCVCYCCCFSSSTSFENVLQRIWLNAEYGLCCIPFLPPIFFGIYSIYEHYFAWIYFFYSYIFTTICNTHVFMCISVFCRVFLILCFQQTKKSNAKINGRCDHWI